MAEMRIGISGWTYGPWRGIFYPKGLAHRRELEYSSRQLDSIEINGTFYSMQRPTSFQKWHDETPDDFVFAIKGSRYLTHMLKLSLPRSETALANFFAQGVLALGPKLGPVLWQFPQSFGLNLEKFSRFFGLLPRDTKAALALAKRHDARLEGRTHLRIDANRPLRYAVEVRHPSFLDDRFIRLLREHNIAFVFADTAGRWPYTEDLTADFIYCRLHGAEQLYASGYTDEQLAWWAQRIRAWRCGAEPADARRASTHACPKAKQRDVYCYFDNDVKVRAPFDAMRLAAMLADTGKPLPETIEPREGERFTVRASAPGRWGSRGRRGTGSGHAAKPQAARRVARL